MKPYYSEAGIEIYHGDCRDVLPSLAKADLVLTDPPYDGYTHRGAFTKSARIIQNDKAEMGIGFMPISSVHETVSLLMSSVEGRAVVFCALEMLGAYQVADPDRYVRGGIWDRITNTPQISGDRPAQGGEGVAIFHSRHGGRMTWKGGGKAAIWRYQVEAGLKYHPTQKPLKLIREIASQFAPDGGLILDPFMGSGTTLRAAKDLGVRAIGVEIDERYCEIAAKRMSQSVLNFNPEQIAIEATA